MIIKVDPKKAEEEGKKRQLAHKTNSTVRFFEDPNTEDIMGVKAELAFAEAFGLEPDLNSYEFGDGGVDFTVKIGGRKVTIDVKGAKHAYHLFVKEKDINQCADILVLGRVEGDEVYLLGWEHKSVMLCMPVKEFGYSIKNYYRHYSELRPMWQLKNLLKHREV